MADKFCSNCGAKSKPDAVVCQKCNTAFPVAGNQSGATPVVVVQQKKGGFFRKAGIGCLGLIVLIVVIAIIATAIGGGSKSGSSSSTLTPNTGAVVPNHPSATSRPLPTSPPPTSPPTSKTAGVGSLIHVPDNLDVTLTGVTLSSGTEFEKPHPGNEYAVTHWTFHNYRTDNTDVADTGFTAQSNGVITNPEFASSLTSNDLGSSGTTLAPGGTIRRDIVFQISSGAPATIIYKPSDFTANWTIHG